MAVLPVDPGLELVAQHGHALGQGVAVLAALDGVDGGLADRLGNVEVGLADREVDRVGELRAQVKDLANAGAVEGLGSVGDPVGRHGMEWAEGRPQRAEVGIRKSECGGRGAVASDQPESRIPTSDFVILSRRPDRVENEGPPWSNAALISA